MKHILGNTALDNVPNIKTMLLGLEKKGFSAKSDTLARLSFSYKLKMPLSSMED